ncbi:hypothetical protein PtA15_1A191 [Puccinia triticina]|uniref:Uncharacterized protein n=1 Tax=Puccinia triticina TaxID=208348 RepID=A0ABY7C7K0_9BASI|nr:uncharacterized protein PtA15_1A191 [Puccinia triticina]WAQ80853.1 hypothetical protein PtA15_1A191 [Puccinia triticina]
MKGNTSKDFRDFLFDESTTPPLEELDSIPPPNAGNRATPPSDADRADEEPVADVGDSPAPAGDGPAKSRMRAPGTPAAMIRLHLVCRPNTHILAPGRSSRPAEIAAEAGSWADTAPRRNGKSPSQENDTKPRRSTNASH